MKLTVQRVVLWWLVMGTTVVSVSTAAVSISLLYRAAYTETLKELEATATVLASMIEAVAEFDQKYSDHTHPKGSWGATLSQIEQGLRKYRPAHASEDLVIGRREGDNMIITRRSKEHGIENVTVVKGDGLKAQPMMHALFYGETGSGAMLDYAGKTVMAGYAPVTALNLAVVYKFDQAEMRWPYIRAAILACFITLIFTLLGAFGISKLVRPLQRQADTAQQEMMVQHDALNEAQRLAKVGSWDLDLINNKLTWSDEIFRMFEIEKERFSASYEAFLQGIHQDDREAVNAAYTKSLTLREPYEIVHRLQMPDGRIKFVRESCESVFDEAGKPLRSMGTVQDITELHKTQTELEHYRDNLEELVKARTIELAEANDNLHASMEQLKQTQSQLVQSEKMASLGGLVAGVAHEINTPVGVSVTAVTHLEMKLEDYARRYQADELTREDFEGMLKSATETSRIIHQNLVRAANLVRSFKQVAVDQTSNELRSFNLCDYLREVLQSLQPKLKVGSHHVNLTCPVDIELTSHPGALSQVMTNLVMNSVIHGFDDSRDGDIEISVSIKPGGLILIDYRDNGKGMSEATVRKVFEPFFTTRRGQGGSGLGMHIVYNLVTQTLGGRIECSSIEGQGASFHMELPNSAVATSSATGNQKRAS